MISATPLAEKLQNFFGVFLQFQIGVDIVKGDNPLCLYHYSNRGVYVYASTETILEQALNHIGFLHEKPEDIPICCGDILKIDANGNTTRECFDDSTLGCGTYFNPWYYTGMESMTDETYLDELKSVAAAFGYTPESIDRLHRMGFLPDEIEDFLYENAGVM